MQAEGPPAEPGRPADQSQKGGARMMRMGTGRTTTILKVALALGLVAMLGSSILAGEDQAAQALSWPQEWVAFGPVPPSRGMQLGGLPESENLLPGEQLATVPEKLEIRGLDFEPEKVVLSENAVDLGKWFGGKERGKTVYLFARLRLEEDTRVRIGTGADWFMQWWVDGRPVFNALETGNRAAPIAITNHEFEVPLSAGEHVLAVAVISGSNAFVFAAGGPRELAAARTDEDKPPAQARAEAARVLEDPEAGNYKKAEARLTIAQSYAQEQDFARAREMYAEVVEHGVHPFYVGEAHLGIGDTFRQEQKFLQATEAYRAVLETEECRKTHRAIAQKKLDALYVRYRMRHEHPRLFLNQDQWPAIRERALGPQAQVYDRMTETVDDLPEPEAIDIRDWGSKLAPAAFVYRVTRDEALLEKIKRMLHASLDYYHEAHAQCREWGEVRRFGLNYPFTRIGWLAAFDWVYNDLLPPERTELARGMLDHVHDHLSRWPNVRYFGMAFYCSDNIYWYAGVTLLDETLPDADYLRALTILEEGYHDHQRMLNRREEARDDDGGFTTPHVEYTLQADSHAEYSFFHSWRAAMDADISPEWSHSALMPNCLLWNALPGFQHFGIGFAWHTPNRAQLRPSFLAGYLAQHMHFFADSHPQLTAVAHYFFEKTGSPPVGKYGYVPMWTEIWSPREDLPPPELPEGLPMARHFEESGLIFMRSGHGPQDTYALFNAGGGAFGSGHYDATHFAIYKRGFLALDTGTRNAYPQSGNYYPQTVAHNCVLIRMPDEAFKGEWGEDVEVNSAGQNRRPAFAEPIAFETGPLYSYAASDATPTYNPDKCARMVRQFVFVPPDHFVVFDRVASTKAEYPKRWLLHTGNEPRVQGQGFRADQDEGRLFCRILYPEDATLEKIGGPGKEFWADGRNWPLPDSWWSQYSGRSDRTVPEMMGRWRVEVRPGMARTQDWFLHLVQASDQDVEAIAESALRQSAERLGVEFTSGARTCTVTFNKSGDVGGHIRIAAGDRTLVDADLTDAIEPQAGLALSE